MCTIWVTDASDFYSSYEKSLINEEYSDAKVEELKSTDVATRIESEFPDAIVLDSRLPFISSLDLVEKIEKCSPKTTIIISYSDRRGLQTFVEHDIMVISKPINSEQFLAVIGEVYYNH